MKSMTVIELNDQLMRLIKNERKLTQEILSHILLFEKCGGYLKLGYSSMFQYLTRQCGYSEDQAYRRLKAARLLNQVPEVAEKLQSGALNLSQAAQAQRAFEQVKKETGKPCSIEIQKSVLIAIQNTNNFETKKTLAQELNLKAETEEKVKPQSNKTIRLEMTLTQNQFKKLNTIKSLLSHKIPDQNTGAILEAVFDFFIEKKQKALTHNFLQAPNPKISAIEDSNKLEEIMATKATKENKTTSIPTSVESAHKQEALKEEVPLETQSQGHKETQSRYIPAATKRELLQRSHGACEHIGPHGDRCGSRYQVQIEHIIPFSLGGSHQISNLKCYCRSHNLHSATQQGIGFETTSFFSEINEEPKIRKFI